MKSKRTWKCQECSKIEKTKHGLAIHVSKHHRKKVVNNESSKDNIYRCDVFHFEFVNNVIFEKHKKECHEAGEIIQTKKRNFREENEDKIESDNSSDANIVKCQYCDLKLESKTNLQNLETIKKHHETCLCKPKQFIVRSS